MTEAPETLLAELQAARDAETKASRALGDAQLAASTGGVRVDKSLLDDMQAATQRRIALEAAVASAERQAKDMEHTAGQARRRARLDAVRAAIDELEVALQEIDAGLQAFAETGAARRAHEALTKLLPLCTDASESILSPSGWLTTESLTRLRTRRTGLIDGLAVEALRGVLRGDFASPYVSVLAPSLRCGLIADLEIQSEDWATT
jgi:hypothetical protein